MYRKLLVTIPAALIAAGALAQQPQRPSDEEINARLQAVSAQRNAANDQVAALAAALQVAQAGLEKAHKAAEACKPKKDEAKQK